MAQIIAAIIIGVWFYRSARRVGKNGVAWCFISLVVVFLPSIILSLIGNETFVPSLIRSVDSDMAVFVGLFLGVGYVTPGVLGAWALHRHAFKVDQGERPEKVEIVAAQPPLSFKWLALTYFAAMVVQHLLTLIAFYLWYHDTGNYSWRNLTTFIDAVPFAFILCRRWNFGVKVLAWGLYAGLVAIIKDIIDYRILAAAFVGHNLMFNMWAAVSGAIMMTALQLGLRLKRPTVYRFTALVVGMLLLRHTLWYLIRWWDMREYGAVPFFEGYGNILPTTVIPFTCMAVVMYFGLRKAGAFREVSSATRDETDLTHNPMDA